MSAAEKNLLQVAIITHSKDVVKHFVETKDLNETFFEYVKNNNLEGVSALVDAGFDYFVLDNLEWNALHLVSMYGHIGLAKYFLHLGISLHTKTKYIEYKYWSLGGYEVVQQVVRMTPIELAIGYGHIDLVKLYVEKGANINVMTYGDVFNQRMVNGGRAGYEDTYLESGTKGLLHIAAECGQLEILKYLVSKGIDIKQQTMSGFNILHCAALKGHAHIVKYALEQGFDVREKTGRSGYTPLHLAYTNHDKHNDYRGTVNLLLQNGADKNTTCDNGYTPEQISESLKNYRMD